LSFSNFNLQKDFISSIEAAGYQSPTPLQSKLIPIVKDKKNALIWTQSASGKTGAFLIPAMNYILENPDPEKRGARILILTSRRDRVSQINYTIKRLSKDHLMRFGFIVSGRPYQTQMRLMRRPLDIMIATPGRLNDLMSNGKADFSQLEMLIIDDLTAIHKKNLHELVEQIIEQAGPKCTAIVFLRPDDEVTPYAKSLFPDAVEITVDDTGETDAAHIKTDSFSDNKDNNKQKKLHKSPQHAKQASISTVNANDLMPQKVHVADDYTHKIAMMDHLMDEFAGEPTLIYVATNKAAKMLQENLANHGHAADLIQDISPEEIDESDILILCDQDKVELSPEIIEKNDKHIVHFDLPRRTDKYLERLNRHNQAREEASLLLVDGYNYNELKHIEKTLGKSLEQTTVPGLEPLNPFVNLSRPKPNKKQHGKPNNRNNKNRQNAKGRSKTNNNRNNNNQNNKKRKNTSAGNQPNSDNNQRRQRKGPFGRLNGGANRKGSTGRNTPKVGVSSRGTSLPNDSRGWQKDFAEPQERKAESKNVVIRYSKKRSIVNPDKPDDV